MGAWAVVVDRGTWACGALVGHAGLGCRTVGMGQARGPSWGHVVPTEHPEGRAAALCLSSCYTNERFLVGKTLGE